MKYINNERNVEFISILEDKDKASVFRHFKGSIAHVITIAKNSETGEELVIYKCTNNNDNTNHKDGIYARPIDMFFSEVDHDKYPDVEQKYRFEKI